MRGASLFKIQWNSEGKATAMGQLAFFAEFLRTCGLFEHWLQNCPLHYTSSNAPQVRDVLGPWLLGIPDGQERYAHVGALRVNGVAPEVLGMGKIIWDVVPAVRQAAHRCDVPSDDILDN
jgi:hypothetical protein